MNTPRCPLGAFLLERAPRACQSTEAWRQLQQQLIQTDEPNGNTEKKEPWQETGLVFTWEDGRAYHPEYLSQVFERLIKKLDLPPVRFHDLRHCAATLSLAAGIHMKKIQALLGHSSYALTADTYTSVLPQFEKAEADAPVALVPRAGKPQEAEPDPDVPEDEPEEADAAEDGSEERRSQRRPRGHGRLTAGSQNVPSTHGEGPP